VVTVIGLQFGALLGGAVVTETIFAWPGLGWLSVQAVQARDFPLVRAIVAVVSMLLILINLLTDLLYAYLNPRIRLG
jgi:ABC-type dipeptide/oligopeptide/nickel transport system permease component